MTNKKLLNILKVSDTILFFIAILITLSTFFNKKLVYISVSSTILYLSLNKTTSFYQELETNKRLESFNKLYELNKNIKLITPNDEKYSKKISFLENKIKEVDDNIKELNASKNPKLISPNNEKITFLENEIRITNYTFEEKYNTILTILKEIKLDTYNYELVYNRTQTRKILLESIEDCKNYLILVCPWLSSYGLDSEVKNKIKSLINRNGKIYIGWGHLSDLDSNLSFNKSNLLKSKKVINSNWKYDALSYLETLQSSYPNNLFLTLAGTHEKYIVCDNKFAFITSHNFLTSNNSSPEKEFGLKTNNPTIIKNLIERFNSYNSIKI